MMCLDNMTITGRIRAAFVNGVWLFGLSALLMLSGCTQSHLKNYEAIYWPSPPDPPRFVYEGTLRNSEDLDAFTGLASFKTAITGAVPRGTMAFQKPYDIAAGGGRLVVSDTISHTASV